MGEWIKKILHTHTHTYIKEYNSAFKKKKKERNPATGNNLNEFGGHCTK